MKLDRRWGVALLLAGVVTSAGGARGADVPPEFEDVRASIERRVADGDDASVAVAVVRDDAITWAEGFGQANREAGTAATPDTPYWMASVSKPITATGLMILVDRRQVDLDAPANRYLPGEKLRAPIGSADAITVRRLANHTSGLPVHYQFFYDGHQAPPRDETIRRYGFASKEPGSAWEYSNLGFGILDYITEVVSGTPWPEFMEREVYGPLGMTHTADRVTPDLQAIAAVPYTRDVGGRFVPVGPYGFDHPGASTIWSSATDLARFARMHLRGGELDGARVLSPESTRAMQELTGIRGEGAGSGIGWAISTERGRRCISHSGAMPGVSTLVRLFPDDGVAIIVLRNCDGFEITRDISDRIAEALFAAPEAEDKAKNEPDGDGPGQEEEGTTRWIGTWSGLLADPAGDLPVTLEIEAADAARVTFGDAESIPLSDISFGGNQFHAGVEGTFRTQPYYHGPTTIELHLDHRDDRLTGVARAVAPGYFALPHWVDLSRDAGGAENGNRNADAAANEPRAPARFEVIIAGGRIVDGCGTPWYLGDLGIKEGRIAAIGRLDPGQADRVIDASGLVVAPGFVDMMGQTAAPFLRDPRAGDNLLTQGITTINAGEGDSDAPLSGRAAERAGWATMAEFLNRLDEAGMPVNAVQTVGHTQVRRLIIGDEDRRASPEEMGRMEGLVREAMEAGAIGLSTSLIYPPAVYAPTEEIVALARVAGSHGGRYYTHMRNEGDRLLEAIDEALDIGRRAGTPVHIFHLKTAGQGNWPKMDQAIARIKAARADGHQVGADIYPYLNNGLGIESFIHPRHSAEGAATLRRRLDDPEARAAIRREMERESGWENWYRHIGRDWDNVVLGGMRDEPYAAHNGSSLGAIARALGKDPWDVFFEVARSGAFALPQSMSEANKIKAMQQEFISFDTDVGPAGGSSIATHPRAFGSFPRVLARYVRELGVLSLEQAVARMTAVAANELGIHDRGRLAPGLAADVVVFDFGRIRDRATLAEPSLPSEGVRFLLVNGQLVLDDGIPTEARPGRVLHGPGYRARQVDEAE